MCLTEAGTRLTAAPRVHAGGCVADTARPVPVPPLPITAPHGSPYEVGLRESPYVRKIAYTVRQSGARPCCAVHSLHCGLLPAQHATSVLLRRRLGRTCFLPARVRAEAARVRSHAGARPGAGVRVPGRHACQRGAISRLLIQRTTVFASTRRRPTPPPATSTSDTPVTDRFGAPGGGRKVTFGPGGLAVRSPRTSLSSICSPMSAAKPAATSAIRATGGKLE